MSKTLLEMATKFSGDNSYYNDSSSAVKGALSKFPASIPKFSQDNSINGMLATGFRMYLPVKKLYQTNLFDRDILQPLENNRYIELIVEQVSESFNERTDVKRLVNGGFVTYYFGSDPPQFTYAGKLLNDMVDDWRNKFLRMYTRYIRGTQLAKLNARLVLSYSDVVVDCECTQMSLNTASMSETYSSFQMSVVVHKISIKQSPIVSNILVKDPSPLVPTDVQPVTTRKKTNTTVVRSQSGSDTISQQALTPEEKQRKIDALEAQRSALQEQLITLDNSYLDAQNAVNTILNSGDPLTADYFYRLGEAQARVKEIDASASVVSSSISAIETSKKAITTGALGRETTTQRQRSGVTSVVPASVPTLSPAAKPKVNTTGL